MKHHRKKGEAADIPVVIPEIVFNEFGEPLIARELVLKPSPVPFWLALLLAILGALTLANGFWVQHQRTTEAAKQNRINHSLILQLEQRQQEAEQDRDRLRTLVIDVLNAKTRQQSVAALKKFLAEEKRAEKERQGGVAPTQTPSPSQTPKAIGSGGGASPKASGGPTPSPTSTKPSPSPSPSPLICQDTPQGRICVSNPRSQQVNFGVGQGCVPYDASLFPPTSSRRRSILG